MAKRNKSTTAKLREILDAISDAVEKKIDDIMKKLRKQEKRISRLETSQQQTDKLCHDLQSQVNHLGNNMTSRC